MSNVQENSNKIYAKMIKDKVDRRLLAGRSIDDDKKLDLIVEFIFSQLQISSGDTLLDIGCGAGGLVERIFSYCRGKSIKKTLIDIPEVLATIDTEDEEICLISGNFPNDLSEKIESSFDRILLYSVLHYVENPMDAVESAVSLLKPGGRLLVGDLPNICKKGRFLASEEGRQFEADYRGVSLKDIPVYKNHDDFISKNKSNLNLKINDELVGNIFEKFRLKGFSVYVLEQPIGLPFSKTREDILIVNG